MKSKPFQPIKRLKKSLLKKLRRFEPTRRLLEDRAERQYLKENPGVVWRMEPRAPVRVVEAGRAQIHDMLYLFGGYKTLGEVSNRYFGFDLDAGKWVASGELPDGMAHTHQGIVTDEQRYAYIITGQPGPNCAPCSPACFSFDFKTQEFADLPPLPEGRYMPVVFLYEGRVHCLSGSSVDRMTPAQEHWSLAVGGGQALETEWRVEPSFPWMRTHTASCVVGSRLYILAGQVGDVPAIPKDPEFVCRFDVNVDQYFDEAFYVDLQTGESVDCARVPMALSHTEHGVLHIGSEILLVGGIGDRMVMNDRIFAYDIRADEWRDAGTLPYPMKSKVTAYWNGRLYLFTGQEAVSATDLRPGKTINSVWSMAYDVRGTHE